MQTLWGVTSKLGLRPLTVLTYYYSDTCFCFSVDDAPGVKGHVALTIDDGLCRSGAENSMAAEVRQLLKEHDATATFFLCSEYIQGPELEGEARALIAEGHEFGNHCTKDGTFTSQSAEEFDETLLQSMSALEAIAGEGAVRWFRAPQGLYTSVMASAIKEKGLKHALGDTYCDDWMDGSDPQWIAATMLNQVRDGSVMILHMPEKNFRGHCYTALKELLEGLQQRNLKAVSLSKLEALAEAAASQT
eukprot:TRINITY_DN79273_c0_g1_i2.p1 TRINITY_DN79273_c0_g1~~TRINITY_DN79273_c0_g1_i2.p1  ORF type:complete len:247 (+),score=59.50 TRINITY_DN79273_c0_g1_i2:46-786(+)